jgi:hypothetical protein
MQTVLILYYDNERSSFIGGSQILQEENDYEINNRTLRKY